MGIGLKIKELASKNKITLAQLAVKLGKTKQAVYEIAEKDDVNTSLLRELSLIFNVPVSYFFDESPAQNSAIASGRNSIAAVNSDVNGDKFLSEHDELIRLRVENEMLKQQLNEKERLIQVLMNK